MRSVEPLGRSYFFVRIRRYRDVLQAHKVKVEDVEPGRAVLYVDVEDIHCNGNGSLHGGVYTSL